jgi:hypothetical protein
MTPGRRHFLPHAAALALVLTFVAGSALHAENKLVERTVKGASGRDIRLGIYVNVGPNCQSGPLPSIRLRDPPQHGKVTVREAKVRATNYKKCLALEVPGFVAFYRSQSNFSGIDELTLTVEFPNGRTELQKIRVDLTGNANREL